MASSSREVDNELIEPNILIDSDWVDFARLAIRNYQSKYCYYIHTSPHPIEVGGGLYGSQTILPMRISASDEDFLVSTIERLDSFIDLDFERTFQASAAVSRYFMDSKIAVDGNPLALVVTNSDQYKQWFEIFLDGSRLVDLAYRRYASLHEYGHTLGLEHPFNDDDGDSFGGTNPWTSNIFPEDTVMAYRKPHSGQWPQWFSDSDIRALVDTWGLEDDKRGSYQLSSVSSGQPLMIGDPVIAEKKIVSGTVLLDGFKACQREVYGSSADDKLYGIAPSDGGWTHEWFYVGEGDDLVLGGGGRDQLLGGYGDDTLRGGHGQDVIEGGFGDDQLYGGGGRNTLLPGSGQDSLYILSDHVSHGELAGRNHNGSLADVLIGVDDDDRITILGCKTEDLNVVELDSGYGIHADGHLEAIILESELSHKDVIGMVSGDETRWY